MGAGLDEVEIGRLESEGETEMSKHHELGSASAMLSTQRTCTIVVLQLGILVVCNAVWMMASEA